MSEFFKATLMSEFMTDTHLCLNSLQQHISNKSGLPSQPNVGTFSHDTLNFGFLKKRFLAGATMQQADFRTIP